MVVTRRQFVRSSALALAAGALRGIPSFGQETARFESLRDGVGIFTMRGGTIGWLVSPDAALVIDSQFADTAAACLEGMRARTARQLDALINTHHHGDHTGGNAVFKPAVRTIVAHANVPGLQRQAADQASEPVEQAYADTTFTDTWSMDLGAETVSAAHYGPAHTGGDIVVTFQNANVAHMGDLMFHHRHPFVDRAAGASVKNWVTVLERALAAHANDTLYIFGHAKEGLPVTGSQADVELMRDYFSAVVEHTEKGIAAGRSRDEVTGLGALPGFEDYAENPPRLTLAGTLGVAYDELTTRP